MNLEINPTPPPVAAIEDCFDEVRSHSAAFRLKDQEPAAEVSRLSVRKL